MIPYLLRWMLILSGLFLLPVLLIRAQPYDDGELRAFLTPPDGCPAPCFMGIRPGVTTVEEVLDLLAKQSIVVDYHDTNGIHFHASHPQGLIDDTTTSSLSFENNQVQFMKIYSNITLGELWAAYGQADWSSRHPLGSLGQEIPHIHYDFGYNEHGLTFMLYTQRQCGHNKFQYLLQAKLNLIWEAHLKFNTNLHPTLQLFACEEYQ